jgi:hypothetical protein
VKWFVAGSSDGFYVNGSDTREVVILICGRDNNNIMKILIMNSYTVICTYYY